MLVQILALLLFVPILLSACSTRQVHSVQGPSRYVGETDLPEAQRESTAPQLVSEGELAVEEVPGELPPPAEQAPHPFAELSDAELEEILLRDPSELGTASLGKTNAGALFGAQVMPEGDNWNIVNARETYGTPETIASLTHAINRVNQLHPGSPALNIGDISKPKGGHIAPHLSHQSGRDVDIGFYYQGSNTWYANANAKNLDMARTWTFIKSSITETDVAFIFLDRSIQALLRDYATEIGEDPTWLDAVFGGPSSNLRPIILHEKGHKTHLHVRYYNPIAQETGRRVYRALLKHKKIKPPTYYLKYKAKRGDSLNRIAKKHKTTVAILKKTNKLRSNRIYAKRTYKIPKRGGVQQPPKLVLPARRIPAQSPATRTAEADGGSSNNANAAAHY